MTSRKNRFMYFWLVLLSLGTLLSLSSAVSHAAEKGLSPPPGLVTPSLSPAMPTFRLPTVNGTTVQSQDLLGKVVVVRFWATW